MKKTIFALALFMMVAFTAAAAGPVLTVVNNTGYTIYYLYVSSSQDDEWGEDLLDDEVLSDGESFKVTLPSTGLYDLRAEDEDEDSYTLVEIDIKRNMNINLTLDDLDDDD